jgi:hypothetical protein
MERSRNRVLKTREMKNVKSRNDLSHPSQQDVWHTIKDFVISGNGTVKGPSHDDSQSVTSQNDHSRPIKKGCVSADPSITISRLEVSSMEHSTNSRQVKSQTAQSLGPCS